MDNIKKRSRNMSIEDKNCMFRTTHITTTANQQHMNMSEKCWKLLNGKLDVVVVDSQTL